MNEVIKFLSENPIQYMATVGLDGKPKVRPFQYMHEQEGKLYFCTSNQKEVFTELEGCPHIEISASSPEFKWIRLCGKVKFTTDIDIKNIIVEKSELVKMVYKTADNPTFEIFYLEDAKAVIADFSGKPPKEYTL